MCVLEINHKIITLLIILLFFNKNISKEMMTNSDRNLCQRLFDQTQNELCGVNISYTYALCCRFIRFVLVEMVVHTCKYILYARELQIENVCYDSRF